MTQTKQRKQQLPPDRQQQQQPQQTCSNHEIGRHHARDLPAHVHVFNHLVPDLTHAQLVTAVTDAHGDHVHAVGGRLKPLVQFRVHKSGQVAPAHRVVAAVAGATGPLRGEYDVIHATSGAGCSFTSGDDGEVAAVAWKIPDADALGDDVTVHLHVVSVAYEGPVFTMWQKRCCEADAPDEKVSNFCVNNSLLCWQMFTFMDIFEKKNCLQNFSNR